MRKCKMRGEGGFPCTHIKDIGGRREGRGSKCPYKIIDNGEGINKLSYDVLKGESKFERVGPRNLGRKSRTIFQYSLDTQGNMKELDDGKLVP